MESLLGRTHLESGGFPVRPGTHFRFDRLLSSARHASAQDTTNPIIDVGAFDRAALMASVKAVCDGIDSAAVKLLLMFARADYLRREVAETARPAAAA